MEKKFAPVKPARSYEEQARRLWDAHSLEVANADRARYLLSTVNYYRLTTYGEHLRRKDDPERFVDGISLDMLYALYEFDMELRHLILPVLEFFEVQLRAKIAYHLAMTYGSCGYMNAKHFRPDRQSQGLHKNLMHKFQTEVKRQDDLPFVRHHNKKYGGKFPIWAAVELFTFGMLSQLYEAMTEADQQAVSEQYDLSPTELIALIDAAVEVRNICAHYNRLYNKPIDKQPILSGEQRRYAGDRIFPILLALRAVGRNERVYHHMVRGIAQLQREFPQADLSLCGFPENWEDVLRGKE